jgi:hypothetical protein
MVLLLLSDQMLCAACWSSAELKNACCRVIGITYHLRPPLNSTPQMRTGTWSPVSLSNSSINLKHIHLYFLAVWSSGAWGQEGVSISWGAVLSGNSLTLPKNLTRGWGLSICSVMSVQTVLLLVAHGCSWNTDLTSFEVHAIFKSFLVQLLNLLLFLVFPPTASSESKNNLKALFWIKLNYH